MSELLETAACNVCGGTRFETGPGERTSRSGRPPRCAACGSLERDRILNRLWLQVPRHEFGPGRTLVLGHAPWRADQRFAGARRLVEREGLDEAVAADRAQYDWIVCQYVLPFVADDRAFFRRLVDRLNGDGVLVVMAPSPATRSSTQDWGEPQAARGGVYRLYGRDLPQRFEGEGAGAFEELRLEDEATGDVESVFLFARERARLDRLCAELGRPREPECSICGGREFLPSTRGRMAPSGLPPRCSGCDSLERHRMIRTVWEALPTGFLERRRCLQFSLDPAVVGTWFGSYDVSIYGKRNSMDLQDLPRDPGSYDVVICNHVLEHVEDDRRAFREVMRVLAPDGFFQFSVPAPVHRRETEDWGYPKPEIHMHYRIYGRDLVERFHAEDAQAHSLVALGRDEVTCVEDLVYFWSRSEATTDEIAGFLREAGIEIVSRGPGPHPV